MSRGAREYQRAELEFMSQEQLVETCTRLSSRQQMMSVLLSELHNERSKLQRHRAMLRERIARVEGSAGPGGGVAAGSSAAAPSRHGVVETAQGGQAASWSRGHGRGERMPIPRDPSSDTTFGATGGGASSSSSQPVASGSRGPSIATALRDRLALDCEVTPPEELLLRHGQSGSVVLTWFYNEQLLEQLENPNHPLQRLSFEVRQQSEGTNGRLRSRIHTCKCRTMSDGDEVCEQSLEIDGCIPGRAYAFSARARAEFGGAASPVFSAFSEVVSLGAFSGSHGPGTDCAASTEGGFSTSASTPRESGVGRGQLSEAAAAEKGLESVDEELKATVEGAWAQASDRQEQARRKLREAEAEARRSTEEAMKAESQAKHREEEARQRLAETRRRLELEAMKRRADEEARRKAEEARRAEQEARTKTEDEARDKRAEDDEAARRVEQEAVRRRVEEEVRRRVEEEKMRIEEDSKRRSEEEKKATEEEARRKTEEEIKVREDAWRQQEEEQARRKAEEAQQEQEAQQKHLEEEVARRVDSERRRWEEEARRDRQEAQRRLEGEALQRRLEEEERARKAEEDRARALDEERQRHAELARQAELDAKRRIDEEIAQRRLEEAKRQAAEKAAEQATRQAQEEARRREEEAAQAVEAARRLEEERRARAAEQEGRRRAEEEALEAQRRAEEEAAKQREAEARMREAEELQKMQEQARRAHAEAQRRMQAEVLERRMEEEQRRRQQGESVLQRADGQEEEHLQQRVEEEIQSRVRALVRSRAEDEEARLREEDERLQREESTAVDSGEQVALDSHASTGVNDEQATDKDKEARLRRMEQKVNERVRDLMSKMPAAGAQASESAPFSSSFAQGFAQYCNNKSGSSPGGGATPSSAKQPASSRGAVGSSRSAGPAHKKAPPPQHSLPVGKGSSRTTPSAASRPRSPPFAAEPAAAPRSPKGLGAVTPAERVQEVMPRTASQANSADPMDKWMNKILAERTASRDAETPVETMNSTANSELDVTQMPEHQRGRAPAARSPPPQQGRTLTRSPLPPEGRRLVPRAGQAGGAFTAATAPMASASALASADGLGPTVMKLPKRQLPGSGATERTGPSHLGTPQQRQHHASASSADHLGARIPEQTRPVNAARMSPTRSVQASVSASPLAAPQRFPQQAQASTMGSAKAVAQQQAQALARQAQGPPSVPSMAGAVGGVPPRTSSFSQVPTFPVPNPQRSQSPQRQQMPGQMPAGPMQQLAPSVSRLRGPDMQRQPAPAPVMAQAAGLEGMVSQRMQRANELAQRLAGGIGGPRGSGGSPGLGVLGLGGLQPPGSQAHLPSAALLPPARQGPAAPALGTTEAFGLGPGLGQAPSLVPSWPQEPLLPQHTQHGYRFALAGRQGSVSGASHSFSSPHHGPNAMAESFEQSQFFDAADPLGLGLNALNNLPPPPRSAPAAEALPAGPGGAAIDPVLGGALPCDVPQPPRGDGLQLSLTVLTSDNRWEVLHFSPGEDLDHKGAAFLRQKGLKAAFQTGLVSKMRAMIQMGQAQSSVDIVDLI